MRIYLLGFLLLLSPVTTWGRAENTKQIAIVDTLSVLPRSGLALYPLYETQHERLAVQYRYQMWQGYEGMCLPQQGITDQVHSVHATGTTRKERWGANGTAEYAQRKRTQVRSIVMVNPELFYPYLLVDTSLRTLSREDYRLQGTLCYDQKRWGGALGGGFKGTTQFGKKDPRPLSRVGDFSLALALGYKLPHYLLAAQGSYRYYSESLSLTNKKEDRQDYVYYLLGAGSYDHDLSVQKRAESIKYILTDYALYLQATPRQGPLPWVQFAYLFNNAFGRTNVYDKVAETLEHQIQGKCLYPLTFANQQLALGIRIDYRQRTGYEIDYYTHRVNLSPLITEEREYHRTAAWLGKKGNYRAMLTYSRHFAASILYCELVGGVTTLHTQHGTNLFEQQSLEQNLSVAYRRFRGKYDAYLVIQGSYNHPIHYRSNWVRNAPFMVRLQRSLASYYGNAHYRLQVTGEVGYSLTYLHRMALALTVGYEQQLGISVNAWGGEVAFYYTFGNNR